MWALCCCWDERGEGAGAGAGGGELGFRWLGGEGGMGVVFVSDDGGRGEREVGGVEAMVWGSG